MKIDIEDFQVKPDKEFSLAPFKTGIKGNPPEGLKAMLQEDSERIAHLQNKLYAENQQSLLIIFQGMDASGKDSAIRNIMAGVNPQGVEVTSFKHPSDLELNHDYLWRHYIRLPQQGQIGIFNRSHYENVLISKVHPRLVLAERIPGIKTIEEVDDKFWKRRFRQIRNFERTIHDTGTQILKFFLHISKDEQKKRFLQRIDQKQKHWKFSEADITERKFWDQYQSAYEQAIGNTSTKKNPWFVVPSDDKWFTQMLISKIIISKLEDMKIKYPVADEELEARLSSAKKLLLEEK